MTFEVRAHTIDCPYCGESLDIQIDTSIAEQRYVEDCQVCCRPIELHATVETDGAMQVIARHEND